MFGSKKEKKNVTNPFAKRQTNTSPKLNLDNAPAPSLGLGGFGNDFYNNNFVDPNPPKAGMSSGTGNRFEEPPK